MKIRYQKVSGWLITACLSVLGFSSCEILDIDRPVEYGTPNANYSVKGRVTDNSNMPIPGIQVTIGKSGLPQDSYFDFKILTTDANGQFVKSYLREFPRDISFSLTFEDVDGPANGEFSTKQQTVEIKTTELKDGGSSWYMGSATKEITVKLDNK